MGLSDGERISKIYFGISGLHKEVAEIDPNTFNYDISWGDAIEVLKSHVDKLWHALLGGTSNGTYWIFGGDADNSITHESNGPWAIAVKQHLDYSRAEAERLKQEEDLVRTGRERAEKDFDPFDGFLDLRSLLGHSHKARESIYNVYAWTEAIVYGLRRYDDKLSSGMSDLSKIISDIQGTCFTIFSKDDSFAKAYVLHRVLRLIFCGSRTSLFLDDTGKKMTDSLCMHHYVSKAMRPETSLADVVAVDKMLGKNPSDVSRVIAALRLSGPRFHYDHQFELLVKRFGEESRAELRPEFDKCKALRDEKEKSDREQYVQNRESDEQYVIHGYEYEESKPPVEIKPTKRKKTTKSGRKVTT